MKHSEGTASIVTIVPAFRWRCYGSRYLKDRNKYRRRRGEACRKTGGEDGQLWDPTVWLVRCRAVGRGGG